MFSFVVSKIFSPYYTSSKAFAYSLSKGVEWGWDSTTI